jgi:hypothetical protein
MLELSWLPQLRGSVLHTARANALNASLFACVCALRVNSVLMEIKIMWYALLVLVTLDTDLNIYSVESIHASEAACLDALVTEHRAEGVCVPVEVQFPKLLPEE